MENPYRQPVISLEEHEKSIVALRKQIESEHQVRERALRLEGARAVLMDGIHWLNDHPSAQREKKQRRDVLGALFIYMLRAIPLSEDGKVFNIEQGRLDDGED